MNDAFGHLNSLTMFIEKTEMISTVLSEERLILSLKHCGIQLKSHMHEKSSKLNQNKPLNRPQAVFSSL